MELLSTLLSIFLSFLPLIAGYAVGKTVEVLHLRSLERREKQMADIMVTNLRTIPENWNASDAAYVDGQAVIGADYFKVFASAVRNIFGGEVRSLETMMQRARREATLRMLDNARALGANSVWNVRMETSTIGRGTGGRKGLITAEIHVYGTALRVGPG